MNKHSNSKEQASKEFNELAKAEGYELLSEYTGSSDKVKLKHLSCGNVYGVRPNGFKNRGTRCRACYVSKAKPYVKKVRTNVSSLMQKEKSKLEFEKIVVERGYEQLSEYTGALHKVKLKHLSCGNVYEVNASSFKNDNRGCPNCMSSGYRKNTQGIFYLVRWVHPETNHSFLKFGITNRVNYLERIAEQQRGTKYFPETIKAKFFLDGSIPPSLEKEIKLKLKTKVIEKKNFKFGYTETCENIQENENFILSLF